MPSQPPPIPALRALRDRVALEGVRFCGADFREDAEGSCSWGLMGDELAEDGSRSGAETEGEFGGHFLWMGMLSCVFKKKKNLLLERR